MRSSQCRFDDLQAEPQSFGVTAAEPFSSLFDLAVAPAQQLLYVGYADTSGSPNRHYRTYKAYDLQSGDQVDLPIEHQPASVALRPALAEVGIAAISYDWLGYEPPQHRIYLVTRGDSPDALPSPSKASPARRHSIRRAIGSTWSAAAYGCCSTPTGRNSHWHPSFLL